MKAFPFTYELSEMQGMDLRDYFAAKAMQAIKQTNNNTTYEDIARLAYVMADAMMKAREVK